MSLEEWVLGLVRLVLALGINTGLVDDGYAVHYERMQTMINSAHYYHQPVSDCMLASPFRPIGTWVIALGPDDKIALCRVVDKPRIEHWQDIVDRDIVAELDANTSDWFYGTRTQVLSARERPITIIALDNHQAAATYLQLIGKEPRYDLAPEEEGRWTYNPDR